MSRINQLKNRGTESGNLKASVVDYASSEAISRSCLETKHQLSTLVKSSLVYMTSHQAKKRKDDSSKYMTEVAKCKLGTDNQYCSVKGSNDEDNEFKTFDSQVFKGVEFCENG